jgi:hypothetical protein
VAEQLTPLRPGEFCRWALTAQASAEGLRRRRKRDQRPDLVGLEIKSDLLALAAEEDPEPDAFESWLMGRVVAAPASGPVRAMSLQILAEYRLASLDPALGAWLRAGAPSDDAELRPPRSDEQVLGCACSAHYLYLRDT